MKRKRLDGRQAVMQDFAEAAAERGQHFFYIRIPESLGPVARGEKYEDPLSEAIRKKGVVTGGGSQLGEGDSIAYCGIDVVVDDRAVGLEVIRRVMRACGAPADTIIEEYLPEYRELPL
jgi:hypothetical protein